MLDSTQLRSELTAIQDSLARIAASARGPDLLRPVRDATGTEIASSAAIWQALHADCLRIAYTALAADGSVDDTEIDELYEYLFTVGRHYASVVDGYGPFDALDSDSAKHFLDHYDHDKGPFGYRCPADKRWPGLDLCRRAAQLGDEGALDRYERLVAWLTNESLHIGHVDPADIRWKPRLRQIGELRKALARASRLDRRPRDLRADVFLSGRRVFSSIAQPSSIFDDDPYDVELVHEQARESFTRLLDRAARPEENRDGNRMFLLLGDSGAGKTHLLRAFRRLVHDNRFGYAAYAQLQSRASDYGRYLLHHVVASLDRPYASFVPDRTGLHEVATGLQRFVGEPLRGRLIQLSNADWPETSSLADHVNDLVDELLRRKELSQFDPDFLRVLIYTLREDPAITTRVAKYLRCEDMTSYDRRWIGEVVPRTGADDPLHMVRNIARLVYVTQRRSLVMMVDQAELAGFSEERRISFRRAVDALYQVVSDVPSAVAVIACLDDLWSAVLPDLSKSARDRLETDPPVARLTANRSYEEIEAIISRRLACLYSDGGAVHRTEEPTYPIPVAGLRELTNRRARDVLDACHRFQERCARSDKLVDGWDIWRPDGKTAESEEDIDTVAAAWNDFLYTETHELPDDANQLIGLLETAVAACAAEDGSLGTRTARKQSVLEVDLTSRTHAVALTIGMANRDYRGGGFSNDVDAVRKAAGKKRTPIIVRTSQFPEGKVSNEKVAGVLKAGGRKIQLAPTDLRMLVALREFEKRHPPEVMTRWRRRDRPITGQSVFAALFDLEAFRAAPAPTAATGEVPVVNPATTPAPPEAIDAPERSARMPGPDLGVRSEDAPEKARPTPEPPPADASLNGRIHAGTTVAFSPSRADITPDIMLRHTAVLGSTGSGKTTLALNLLEQLLEQGIPVLLIDRKGDLAGYARPGWWEMIEDPARRQRANALAERVEVRLFTPGTRGGRPLAFGVVPSLDGMPEEEHDRVIQYASSALAAMMRLGEGSQDAARRAILGQAIAVIAKRRVPASLEDVITLLESRDDDLIARAGRFDDRLFKRLITDLETLRLNDGELFDRSAEQLSADILLTPATDRVPLSIVSTRFLGDNTRTQAWVAHLLVELSRWCMRTPRAQLQAVVMLDEADLYMPAGAARPPSKEPLQDLLKRARSGGLGVMLATQSPGDLDYRSREQINTWFIGRISEKRSIEKLRPLFEQKPTAAAKLGDLRPGHFVFIEGATISEIERAPSMLITDQLGENEIVQLARSGRPS